MLVYDLDIVLEKKGKGVIPVLAASVVEDFCVTRETDTDDSGLVIWVLLKTGLVSVNEYREKGEVSKSTIKLPEVDLGTTLIYNTIESMQDLAFVAASSNQTMKGYIFLVKKDQPRKAVSPSIEIARGKKSSPA